ncbi:MAG: hypothetical protein ABI690_30565 [Chloroflexota bacterium]
MSKLIAFIVFAAIFNIQVTLSPTSDENQVKRLLTIYTPADGTNIDQNADGSLILTGERDTIRLWDATTLEEIYNRKHGQRLDGVLFNAAGDRFITWSNEIVHTWDTATGRLLGTLSIDSNVGYRGAMWHGDQVIDVLGGTINLWDGASPENNHGFLVVGENFNSYPGNAAWDHAQTHFLTWNAAGETVPMVRMWQVADDFESASQTIAFEHGGDTSIYGAAWSPDETMIVSWSQDRVNIWDATNGALLHTVNMDSYLTHTYWSPNSRYVLVEDIREQEMRVWDAQTGEEVLTIPGTDAMWDTTGDRLLVGRVHPELVAVPSGESLAEFPSNFGLGYGRWNADGVRLLVISRASVQVWIIPPQDRCVVYALSSANLRPEPRADSNRSDILPPQRLATVIDHTIDADDFVWWQLENKLWVRSDVVEETGKCFPSADN